MNLKGFWSDLLGTGTGSGPLPAEGPGISYGIWEPRVTYLPGLEWAEAVKDASGKILSMTPAELWRTQPHLRTVVSFVGRNIAQLGLHTFERVSETDRRRDRTNPLALALADPGDRMTTYGLIFALAVDKMLYDRAYWLPYLDKKTGQPRIRRIPPAWVSTKDKTAFAVETFHVWTGEGAKFVDIPADRIIEFAGYSPTNPTGCGSTLEALKETLAEQVESTKYRAQIWKRGGRTSAVIQRPVDAPDWTPEQADRFREDWYANYTGDGPKAGGTPLLEDGMTINRIDFSAMDMQWVEGAKLSFATVASSYHVNPTMVGLLENANYGNVREFRRMLYGDTLGPYLRELEDTINTFALPFFGVDLTRFYAEFNIMEKLQGSFEEQAAVLSTSTGAPWMLRNEARARMNLPELEGGDELVVPLNVLIGGQSSPRDSGTQNEEPDAEPQERASLPPALKALPRGALRVKARADSTVEKKVADSLRAFFQRQERVVRSKLGKKAAVTSDGKWLVKDEEWWDEERWDAELSHDLMALSTLVAGQVAAKTLEAIGFGPDAYDEAVTLAWLKEVSDRSASSLNAATKEKIAAALAGEDPEADLDGVFAAQDSHADAIAVTTVTMLSGFATVEATKQAVGEEKATKTWVTGRNARPEHEALNGETVLLSEDFSNGAAWPGDGGALGAEDLANCNCELEINVP